MLVSQVGRPPGSLPRTAGSWRVASGHPDRPRRAGDLEPAGTSTRQARCKQQLSLLSVLFNVPVHTVGDGNGQLMPQPAGASEWSPKLPCGSSCDPHGLGFWPSITTYASKHHDMPQYIDQTRPVAALAKCTLQVAVFVGCGISGYAPITRAPRFVLLPLGAQYRAESLSGGSALASSGLCRRLSCLLLPIGCSSSISLAGRVDCPAYCTFRRSRQHLAEA